MSTATHARLVEQQVRGLNEGTLEDVVSIYAEDATFLLYSPHTLPGSEMRLEGREAIERHMGRVLKGGIEGVEIDWVDAGDGFVAWRDHGAFGPGIAFSESHVARLNADGRVTEHTIHSVYAKG